MEDSPKQKSSKRSLVIIIILIVIIIVLGGLLGWCWWNDRNTPTPSGGTPTPGAPVASSTGPCAEGADNPTPTGFTFYENASLGYRFAYPTSWGTVSVTTTPIASESGDYVMGRFSANDSVWFGGNATDYVVRGRGGMPTDLPGYLKAGGQYYTVNLWRFTDGITTEDRSSLHLMSPPLEEMAGCNTTALITHQEASEISTVGPADIARFNLQPTSHYYGVNFVIDHPTDAGREDFHKLVRSFQLIP